MAQFLQRLRSGPVVLMDGALGTQLQARGARVGEECLELWNVTHAAAVREVQRGYVQAGAECLLTHTFQAHPSALARHGLPERGPDIWRAAVENARAAASVFVVADVGPLDNLDPSALTHLAATDAICLETCPGPHEASTAAALLPSAVPLLVSFAFRHGPGGTLESLAGAMPEECAAMADTIGARAVGANCGVDVDLDDLLRIVERFRAVTKLPLFVRPNAGTPVRTADGWHYPRSPAAMAERLPALLAAGVRMVGGCCGTTPGHIAAFRAAIDTWESQA